jgi:mannose-6-phosphate isomerase-like protein (cupin superfamily)
MATLLPYNENAEFYTDERCYINELSNSQHDNDCSIALARIEPGITTEVHQLRGTIERYVILEGQGKIESGSLAGTLVTKFDTIVIPADEEQSITNTGSSDLLFLCVCTPRFQQKNYYTPMNKQS